MSATNPVPAAPDAPRRTVKSGTMTGAEAIIRCLEAEGVDMCWGIPGGAILPLYDAFARVEHTVKHYLVTHFKLPPASLVAVGYGKTKLKNESNPFGAENRRVQVVNMSDNN